MPPREDGPRRVTRRDVIALARYVEEGDRIRSRRAYTLTSGIFGTEPRLGGVAPPSPRGPDGLGRLPPPPPPGPPPPRRLLFGRTGGIFSGLGTTGPSRNSKPSVSWARAPSPPSASLFTTT